MDDPKADTRRPTVADDTRAPMETAIKRRWYGFLHSHDGPTGRVQVEARIREHQRTPLRLPEHVLRLAQAEYDRQHPGQPYERMQERGGLGLLEVIALLADTAERHGALPSVPARKDEKGRWLRPPAPGTDNGSHEGVD